MYNYEAGWVSRAYCTVFLLYCFFTFLGMLYEHFTRENCSMSKYDVTAVSRLPFFHNRIHWVSAMDAFEHLQRNRNDYVYEGERFVRGIPTEVWIYKSDDLGQVICCL